MALFKITFEKNEDGNVHAATYQKSNNEMIFVEANFEPNFFENMSVEEFYVEFSNEEISEI